MLDVAAERVRGLIVHPFVCIAMARELVSAARDLSDQVGVALGGHAQHEEGRPRAQLLEEIEDRLRLPLERVARRAPVRPPEATVHELVPILEVEAEQELGHGLTCRASRA